MAKSNLTKIIDWLKRNFTLNLFVAVITVISAWFGYDQFRRANGGKVVPVIFSNYNLVGDYKDFMIVTTGDSIKISNPQIAPFYFNCSDYPIENVNVNYKIECPININLAPVLEINDGFNVRTQTFDSSNILEWSFDYNKAVLFPNEPTPNPFKFIIIHPNILQDSLFNYFDIYSYIVFNGKKSNIFKSRIHVIKYTDPLSSISSLDSINDKGFFKWAGGAAKDIRNRVSFKSDYLFAYHTVGSKGAFSHLKNIFPTDLDSISSLSPSPLFLRRHLYSFEEEVIIQKGIDWVMTILGFLMLLLSGFLTVRAIKEWKSKKTLFILVSLSIMFLCLSYLLFSSVFSYFNYELPSLDVAINSMGIISTLYPFSIGFINEIKSFRSDKSNFFLFIVSYFIIINYLFVSELVHLCK